MPGSIFKKTTIPISLPNLQRESSSTVRSRMSGHRDGVETHQISGLFYLLTEIDIFKPDWPEPFVEAADFFPYPSRKHEESAGRLFDEPRSHRIQSQATVVPIDRVLLPDGINTQNLKNQGHRRGKTARHETPLREAVRTDQETAGRGYAGIVKFSHKRRQTCFENGIGVQQQHQWRCSSAYSLVHRRGKTRIAGVRNQRDAAIENLLPGAIEGGVVDHHDLEVWRLIGGRGDRVEATAYLRHRIIGDNNNSDTGHVSMRRTGRGPFDRSRGWFQGPHQPEIPAPIGIAGTPFDFQFGGCEKTAQRGRGLGVDTEVFEGLPFARCPRQKGSVPQRDDPP